MTNLELLKEIEAWLSFNTEPSKEELHKMRNDIKKHISKQLTIHNVVSSDFCPKCLSAQRIIDGNVDYYKCSRCGTKWAK